MCCRLQADYDIQYTLYTATGKNILNIIDCHLKNKYPILIFLVWLFLAQLAIRWLFNIPPHPVSASALPGENRTSEIWVEMDRNMSKSIPNIIDCNLKTDRQISIIFCANIFDTTCHQMTILVSTLPNVCFWTTWKNLNRRDRIKKMQFFAGFVSTDSAKGTSSSSIHREFIPKNGSSDRKGKIWVCSRG